MSTYCMCHTQEFYFHMHLIPRTKSGKLVWGWALEAYIRIPFAAAWRGLMMVVGLSVGWTTLVPRQGLGLRANEADRCLTHPLLWCALDPWPPCALPHNAPPHYGRWPEGHSYTTVRKLVKRSTVTYMHVKQVDGMIEKRIEDGAQPDRCKYSSFIRLPVWL